MDDREFCAWFSGLIDGEGCFLIDKNLQCKFRISMRNDDSPMLKMIADKLGFGYYRQIQRAAYYTGGNWHKPTSAYAVTSVRECKLLVQLLDEHPLKSKKQNDYKVWRQAVLEAERLFQIKRADRTLLSRLREEIKIVRKYKEA